MVDVVDLAVVESAVVLVLSLEPVGQTEEVAQVTKVGLLQVRPVMQVLVEGEVEDCLVRHCQALRRRPLRVQHLLKREKRVGGAKVFCRSVSSFRSRGSIVHWHNVAVVRARIEGESGVFIELNATGVFQDIQGKRE
jgi:hypothetical protein